MSAKINFKVVGCTGWEDGYSPKNVEIQSPFGRGWRSERYCMYPQQIVLRLDRSVRVRKLQFVSHEFMIASKVEFFIAHGPSSEKTNTTLDTLDFHRLGYVTMSENGGNGHKSREMKSVNVDTVGQYLKFALHTNYVNGFNLFNQVSILAINAIVSTDWKLSPIIHRLDGNHTGRQPPVITSVVDDLSFSLSQDQGSAELIRMLEARKIQAVERDQFEEAKQLKKAVQEYLKVGEVLCVFEHRKRLAIGKEDYDEAKKWKHEKLKLQQQTMQRLGIKNLLGNVVTHHEDLKIVDKPQHIGQDSLEKYQRLVSSTTQSPIPTLHEASKGSPLPMTDSVQPIVSEKSPGLVSHFSEHPDGSMSALPPKPEKLTEAQVNQFTDSIQVLGMETVELLHSKVYQFREEGLKMIYDKLKETSHNKAEMLRAMTQVLKKACNDKVTVCFNLSLSIFQYLLGPYAVQNRLTDGDISVLMDKILPVLMGRLGDTNARIQSSTESTLLELLTNGQLQMIMAQHLVKQLGYEKRVNKPKAAVDMSSDSPVRSVSWRYAKARVELLQKSLEVLNLSSTGLTVQKIMEFVNPCLQHIHVKVRDAAAQLTIQLYKQYDGNVRDCLPVSSGDHIALKNPFWRALFEQMDEVDGKGKMCVTEDITALTERKNNKIKELKGQLGILKSLAAQGRQMTADELNDVLDSENNTGGQQRIGDLSTVPVADIEYTCPFCHVTRPELKQKIRMEQHYKVECPMLQQCKYCSQVVEIRLLPSHYLSKDCKDVTEMSQCPTCNEVYIQSQIENHIKANRCSAPPTNYSKCPLCHANVENTDEAWIQHLMGINAGCAKNPRRKRRNLRPKEKDSPRQTTNKEIAGMAVIMR